MPHTPRRAKPRSGCGPYAPRVAYDVAVVGGGTAGCVLAARLSEDPDRRVCLIEAGPDYGPRSSGAWPTDLLDPRSLTFTHDWGTGGEDERSLGARVIGGCSTHNACMAVVGTPDDYSEWGEGWPCIRHCPPQFGAIFNHGMDVIIIPELCSGCDKCLDPCPVDCIYPDPDWTPSSDDWWQEQVTDDPYR